MSRVEASEGQIHDIIQIIHVPLIDAVIETVKRLCQLFTLLSESVEDVPHLLVSAAGQESLWWQYFNSTLGVIPD